MKSEPICGECGARNAPGSSECWLCQRRNWKRPPGPRDRPPAPEPSEPGPTPAIGGGVLLCAVIAVGLGLMREAPGVAVFLLVSLAPALFFTEVMAVWLRGPRDPMRLRDRIAMTILLMIVIPILIALALVVALLVTCLSR